MSKLRTNKGIVKRFKRSNPKGGKKGKLQHLSKGRGTKHLKTKQTNKRRRRIRQIKAFNTSKISSKILNTI